jgi:predicted alpha/beta superfamily hydrolase
MGPTEYRARRSFPRSVPVGYPKDDGAPISDIEVWLPFQRAGASQIDLTSRKGRNYRIFISVPSVPPPPGGFPIIYLLDGNASFATAMDRVALQMRRSGTVGLSPGIVVGIGYPREAPFDMERRTFDYLTARAGPPVAFKVGGAAQFAEFIETELKPMLESSFPIDRTRQALLGHSFGGLFVLWSLFTQPEMFQAHIAASPSIWWNERAILADADAFMQRKSEPATKARLLITVGGLEREIPFAGGKLNMVADAEALTARLRAQAEKALDVSYAEIVDEDHMSVVPSAIGRGVRFGWAGY